MKKLPVYLKISKLFTLYVNFHIINIAYFLPDIANLNGF